MSDDEVIRLRHLIDPVVDAVRIAGPYPPYHYERLAQLEREWPTLWAALDRLVKEA